MAGEPARRSAVLQRFLHDEAAGSVVMLAAAVVALVWANSAWGDAYEDLWSTAVGGDLGGLHLDLTLQHWVSDALMALFFLLVGLEIKREVTHGELGDRQALALPVGAALGGMVVPALVYLAFNAGGPGVDGWGIPMATDIAFAVGVVTLLGDRVPLAAKVFLLALAVVDDIGAIVVIAVVYTSEVSGGWLAAAVACVGLLVGLRRAGVERLAPYLVVGAALWLALHESGVHATLAGVALGLLVPEAAAERLESALSPWVGFVVLPLFALANAGVRLTGDVLDGAASDPVVLGVGVGLVVGKAVGVSAASFAVVKLGLGRLPAGTTWRHVLGLAVVAGIGFTVSLFVTGLAFDDPALTDAAKLGVLVGSSFAGIAGYVVLRGLSRPSGP